MKKQIIALALLTYAVLVIDANAQRAYAVSTLLFELDGIHSGFLKGVEGGAISAEVIEEPPAGNQSAKHLGQPVYEPFRVRYGFSAAGTGVFDWIAAAWNQDFQRKNGAIIAANHNLDATSRREFFNAVITETTFPACDGASREPGYLTLKFAPEYTRQVRASGKVSGDIGRVQPKAWLPSGFRLTIDGLDCTRIARIESFTVKHVPAANEVGQARDYFKEPGKIDFPNLKITLGSASARTWQNWFESFVIQGRNTSQDEKKGTLEFLSPDRKEVLATLEFNGLGIFRLDASASEADSDMAAGTTAELYCEKMKFIPGRPSF